MLASANKTLKEGGLIDNDMTWNDYASVIDNILTMNDKTLAAGRRKMVRTVWEQEPSFKDSELDLALYLAATKTNHDLEAALKRMQSYDPSMITGLVQLLTSEDAKNTAHEELVYQVKNSQDMADVAALKTSLSQIQVLRLQREPVHRRCAVRCGRCPLCQGRQRPAGRRHPDPVRWREHPEQRRKPAE